jgi:hypothetical protein
MQHQEDGGTLKTTYELREGDSVRDFRIDGIVPIIPTPFFADDRPDWESLRGLIDFAQAAGNCAICLPAYASEFYKLSEEERSETVARAVEYASGRIPVIAQVNFATPRMVIEAASAAKENGATALCSAVPRLIPLSEEGSVPLFRSDIRSCRASLRHSRFQSWGRHDELAICRKSKFRISPFPLHQAGGADDVQPRARNQ